MTTTPSALSPRASAELMPLRAKWGWILALGIIYVIVGFIALGSVVMATAASVLVVGIMMVIAGVAEVINAFQVKEWGRFLLWVLLGVLYIIAGFVTFENPLLAAAVLTLMLGVALIISGIMRMVLAFSMKEGMPWAVALSRRQNVYPADVALIFPVARAGQPRKYHVPDQPPVAAEALLAGETWRRVSWRQGTKGRLTCLFTARRVRVADGHKHRMLDNRVQCMPGEEVWLVGEHRSNGERKYYLSNLPADTPIKDVAGAIKARWICEQAHQQLKEELGLDHFEGRSWTGLHRHALMTMMAYAFLQTRRLAAAGRKKRVAGPPPQPSLPAVRQAILDLFARPPPRRCPHCEKLLARRRRS